MMDYLHNNMLVSLFIAACVFTVQGNDKEVGVDADWHAIYKYM